MNSLVRPYVQASVVGPALIGLIGSLLPEQLSGPVIMLCGRRTSAQHDDVVLLCDLVHDVRRGI